MKVRKTKSIGNGLDLLWEENFFFRPKAHAEISKALERKGFDSTSARLTMALSRAKFLLRKGNKKDGYFYVQRYPYDKNDED